MNNNDPSWKTRGSSRGSRLLCPTRRITNNCAHRSRHHLSRWGYELRACICRVTGASIKPIMRTPRFSRRSNRRLLLSSARERGCPMHGNLQRRFSMDGIGMRECKLFQITRTSPATRKPNPSANSNGSWQSPTPTRKNLLLNAIMSTQWTQMNSRRTHACMPRCPTTIQGRCVSIRSTDWMRADSIS